MKAKVISALIAFLCLTVVQVWTAEPDPDPQPSAPRSPVLGFLPGEEVGEKTKKPDDKSKKPDLDKKLPERKLADPPETDAFAQSLLPSNTFGTGFNPHMMGDFPCYFARQYITVFGTLTTTVTLTSTNPGANGPNTITRTTVTPTSLTKIILVPVPAAGAFKVADNASPRPVDRVFVTGNYFGTLRGPETGASDSFNATNSTLSVRGVSDTVTTSNVFIPGAPRVNTNLYRETFGFEKTFLDGDASIELRVPFTQLYGNATGVVGQNIGDLTVIGKYAFVNDPITGNVVSAGLAVTAPTGPGIQTIDGDLHSTLLQPWAGYIWNADRFYVQAFHSVVVPTDSRNTTFLFNDVGLNYWLYRGDPNRFLSYVVSTAEAHVTTPVNHRDGSGAFMVPDLVVMTGGVHLGIFRNTSLSLGVATPVTGPRVFGVEGFVQLNWRR